MKIRVCPRCYGVLRKKCLTWEFMQLGKKGPVTEMGSAGDFKQ